MTFTFDLASTDEDKAAISQVRARVGDQEENDGLLPESKNVSDEILLQFYSEEGTVNRTIAATYEHLASRWSAYARRRRLGPSTEWFDAAKHFRDMAEEWRDRYGYGHDDQRPGAGTVAIQPNRD